MTPGAFHPEIHLAPGRVPGTGPGDAVLAAERSREGELGGIADLAINSAWPTVVGLSVDVIAWTQYLLPDGDLARAEPKTLRYRLLHVAAAPRPRRVLWPGRGPWWSSAAGAVRMVSGWFRHHCSS